MKTTKKDGNAAHVVGHLQPEASQVTDHDAIKIGTGRAETANAEKKRRRKEQEMAAKKAHGDLKAFGPKILPIAIKLGKALKALGKRGEGDYANEVLKLSPGAARDYLLLEKSADVLETVEFKGCGIVEVLNYLRRKKSPATEKFRFVLADQRRIAWREGLITRESVQVIIDRCATASTEQAMRTLAAQKQEYAIRIACTVNQVCSGSTREQLQPACDALRAMELLLPWGQDGE